MTQDQWRNMMLVEILIGLTDITSDVTRPQMARRGKALLEAAIKNKLIGDLDVE